MEDHDGDDAGFSEQQGGPGDVHQLPPAPSLRLSGFLDAIALHLIASTAQDLEVSFRVGTALAEGNDVVEFEVLRGAALHALPFVALPDGRLHGLGDAAASGIPVDAHVDQSLVELHRRFHDQAGVGRRGLQLAAALCTVSFQVECRAMPVHCQDLPVTDLPATGSIGGGEDDAGVGDGEGALLVLSAGF